MNRPNGRTILLFTRAPEAEARAKRLPIAQGSRLFAGFLKGWQQRAADAGAELLVVTPVSSEETLARILPNARITAQSGGTFGERIESAFRVAFRGGANSVLMVGGDGPPLELCDIHNAFAHLESHDRAFVLAPAADGGVNAIGLNIHAERPLRGIAWQSPDVCRQLQSEAARFDLALLLTTAGYDLDSAGNVAALYRLSCGESGWTAFRWLLLSLLLICRVAAAPAAPHKTRFAGVFNVTRGPPLSLFA